ncbi:MAG: D-glycero-beta-D-manno-heptose 1-phosphate adenylyltransferase [Candidatus Neomarinimicrobiota bacterium]
MAILTRVAAEQQIRTMKERGKRIVFTNGCFDIIHRGHVELLEKAQTFGDSLVVGLNSDTSVRELKGTHRPIQSQDDRAAILNSIGCVDIVVIFEELTPLEIIVELQPDILVKGGDYNMDNIVGINEMAQWNGKVEIIPLIKSRGTSEIIGKIRSLPDR